MYYVSSSTQTTINVRDPNENDPGFEDLGNDLTSSGTPALIDVDGDHRWMLFSRAVRVLLTNDPLIY